MLFTEDLPIKVNDNEIILFIKVTPKSSMDRIGKVFDGCLKIYVRALPEDGQANKAVIDLLSGVLKISKKNIFIINGFTSNKKQVKLFGDKQFLIKCLKMMI